MPNEPRARVTRTEVTITFPLTIEHATDGASSIPTAVENAKTSNETPGPRDRGRDRAALTHSPDFSAVAWRGEQFTFSRKQRLVVAALWLAREDGYDWVSTETLLDAAESDGGRVRALFGKHPAWGTLIVSALDAGGTPGTYRLAE